MKTFLKILGIICIMIFIFIVILNVKYSNTVLLDDSDLVYQPMTINPSDNGFEILLPTLKELKTLNSFEEIWDEVSKLSMLKTELDIDRANALIVEHLNLRNQLSNALQVNFFHMPFDEDFISSNAGEDYFRELIFIGNLEALNARLLLNNKDYDQAGYSFKKLLKLAYLLQNSDNDSIGYLLGFGIKEKTIELLNIWIKESHFGVEYYKNFLADIAPYLENSGLDATYKIEYRQISNLIKKTKRPQDFFKAGPVNKEYKKSIQAWRNWGWMIYNENKTLNELARIYRQEIHNINKDFKDMKHFNVSSRKKTPNNFFKYLSGNICGEILMTVTVPNHKDQIQRYWKVYARCHLTKLMLAMKAYQVENRQLPHSLDDLMPSYIQGIPADPFDGKFLRYSQVDKKIYSIGPDLKDDRGENSKDIIISLEF